MFANVIRFTTFAVAEIIALLERCVSVSIWEVSPLIFGVLRARRRWYIERCSSFVGTIRPVRPTEYVFAVLVTAGAIGTLGKTIEHRGTVSLWDDLASP